MTRIICCSDICDPSWRWVAERLNDTGLTFEFVSCAPRSRLERNIRFLNFARLRGCLEAALLSRNASALVTHGPTIAAWCAIFARFLNLRLPIFAFAFNFSTLPRRPRRSVFAWAFSRVNRFVVFSEMERHLYSAYFGLDPSQIDMIHWGITPPAVHSDSRVEEGDYVCAIGGNARDYRTLMEAAYRLPAVRFVLVVRPESLAGIRVPYNCKIHTNLPFERAVNVLWHSRFMVLPLRGSEVPCGHVTLVLAMHLGKAAIVTESSGIRDYVRGEDTAITVKVGSVESLIAAIERLWTRPEVVHRIGNSAKRFAAEQCTAENDARHFRSWLEIRGII